MTSDREILVPEARQALDRFKGKVMAEEGYSVGLYDPEKVKYEVAEDLGIDMDSKYNGEMTTKEAGKIGGAIGGKMVQEMIKLAEQSITNKYK